MDMGRQTRDPKCACTYYEVLSRQTALAKPSEGETSGNPKTPENQRTILLMHEKRANNFFSRKKIRPPCEKGA